MLQLAINKQQQILDTLRAETNSAQKVFDLLCQDTEARQKVLAQINKDIEKGKQDIYVLEEQIKTSKETFQKENALLLVISRNKSKTEKEISNLLIEQNKLISEHNFRSEYLNKLNNQKIDLENEMKNTISINQKIINSLEKEKNELEQNNKSLSEKENKFIERERNIIDCERELKIRKLKVDRLYSDYLKK